MGDNAGTLYFGSIHPKRVPSCSRLYIFQMLTKDTTTYKMRGYGYCTVICFKGPYIKDVRTEGEGGSRMASGGFNILDVREMADHTGIVE